MGYSASQAAFLTMDRISNLIDRVQNQTSSNTFTNDAGETCFWERGRENADGAMTGTVKRIISEKRWKQKYSQHGPYLPNRCENAGTFRIDPDGKVIRFAQLPKEVRKAINNGEIYDMKLSQVGHRFYEQPGDRL